MEGCFLLTRRLRQVKGGEAFLWSSGVLFLLKKIVFCAAHGQNLGLTLNRFVAQSQGVDPKQKEATFVANSQQAAKAIQQMMVVLKGCFLFFALVSGLF